MKEYSNKDIAGIVGIAGPTVRKYSALLEKAGYTFNRNEQGHRLFLDRDIPVFREVKERSEVGALPLERITEEVATKYKRYEDRETEETGNNENPVSPPATTSIEPALSQHIVELTEAWEIIKAMAERVDMMGDTIMELKEENRRLHETIDKRFIETIREIQDTKRQIAASQEEPKGIWARLFKK